MQRGVNPLNRHVSKALKTSETLNGLRVYCPLYTGLIADLLLN